LKLLSGLLFSRKRQQQVVILAPYSLSHEEMRLGIALLPCKICEDTTRHKIFPHKPFTSADPWESLKAQCKACGHVRRF
jgi:hypothetical protein